MLGSIKLNLFVTLNLVNNNTLVEVVATINTISYVVMLSSNLVLNNEVLKQHY
jgi:hypothetical protein